MSDISAPPIDRPAPVLDGGIGSDEAAVRVRRARKSWREQRWERRRRRRFGEEVLGWILVPIILVAGYWSVKAGLNALGTSPTALYQQIRALSSSKS